MDFLALLKRLSSHEVEFVIVGGYASTILGSDLLTQDLDVCIRLSSENLHRLYDAIEDLNPRYRMHPAKPPLTRDVATAPNIKNLYLQTDLGPLDCLGSVLGLGDYDAVLAESVKLQLRFGAIWTLDFKGLIKSKEKLNREKDQLTIAKLKAIQARLKQDE